MIDAKDLLDFCNENDILFHFGERDGEKQLVAVQAWSPCKMVRRSWMHGRNDLVFKEFKTDIETQLLNVI